LIDGLTLGIVERPVTPVLAFEFRRGQRWELQRPSR
jgi:hypothetical protein